MTVVRMTRDPNALTLTVVAADQLFAAVTLLGHEAGPFEHGDVLLDCGEAHGVPLCERGHRRLVAKHARDDVAARRVGKGGEDQVHRLGVAQMYNHKVVCCTTVAPRARGAQGARKGCAASGVWCLGPTRSGGIAGSVPSEPGASSAPR